MRLNWLCVALAVMALNSAIPARAADSFSLRSTAFEEGGSIPVRFGGDLTDLSPNCVGQNISPALSWSNPPPGTRSYALVFSDPEASNGLGAIHWLAYDISASVAGFAEGEVGRLSDKYVGGKSSFLLGNYVGPCAPAGAMHHYTFVLIATDLEPNALSKDLTWEELKAALKGHAKGATGLMGLYARH